MAAYTGKLGVPPHTSRGTGTPFASAFARSSSTGARNARTAGLAVGPVRLVVVPVVDLEAVRPSGPGSAAASSYSASASSPTAMPVRCWPTSRSSTHADRQPGRGHRGGRAPAVASGWSMSVENARAGELADEVRRAGRGSGRRAGRR